MSTEHQKYSTENQADAICRYAAARSIDIVRTYADEGKSGLSIDGRDALKRLLEDVESKHVDFDMILVYDVSRWGRFQDADESAYYEYICRRSGITVHYCAEQFENDGSPVSTIVKGVKRAMAGEYSRELSAKVFTGQCRLIELGYRQGGSPGYGLRRRLIDQSGATKAQLSRGEHKSLQTDRVVLVAGPADEVAVVQEIYHRFVKEGLSERPIADDLNLRGIQTDSGRPWTKGTVHQILINEKGHWEQCLELCFIQAEKEARAKSSRHLDSLGWSVSSHSSTRACFLLHKKLFARVPIEWRTLRCSRFSPSSA